MSLNTAKRKAEPDFQLEDYAFNIFGHAMALPQEHREQGVLITALGGYLEKYSWRPRLLNERPSIQLNNRERSAPGQGSKQYLLVGWMSRLYPDRYRTLIVKKGRPAGTFLPENVLPWDDKSLAYMVVAPILKARPQMVKLYALIPTSNDLTSLKKPYEVHSEWVFYLPQYRDSSINLNDRKTLWNQKVLAQSVRPDGEQVPAGDDQEASRFTPSQDKDGESEPEDETSQGECCMDKIIQVLKEKDPELKARLEEHRAVSPFLDLKVEFRKQDSIRLYEYCQHTWPELKWTSPDVLLRIRKAMKQSTAATKTLRHSWLPLFISEASFALKDDEMLQSSLIIDYMLIVVVTISSQAL
ncbi:uncharacterized protein BDZ99DRAFT_560041 [Mytilinidion resinicola]|uniref:Uncharacterized protein n=1 Tax=Mytilinidion resinicola TaxID=574789 RepID=A0A6A6YT61_9PEZI|nr:uncharacterized protein BDZ99DRAFT_560041 [Mytilinidion resinicola]KAF2811709.1 hypothetical protein BDZ99DRAFT_560041 [Mytilinidion resinicola]